MEKANIKFTEKFSSKNSAFDLESYYDSKSKPELEQHLKFTLQKLEKSPSKFYGDFANYLRKKINEKV